MDDLVRRAMARWPDVPAAHGWLRLTARGNWNLVDRHAPGFDPVADAAGSLISSPPLIDFIARNYAADEQGRWFWQNGPQRCFVTIERAPLIVRVLNEGERTMLLTHTGLQVRSAHRAWIDADGNFYLATDLGPCAIDDRDLARLEIDQDEAGRWQWTPPTTLDAPRSMAVESLDLSGAAAIGQRLGFIADP